MVYIRKLTVLFIAGCATIVAMPHRSSAQAEPPKDPRALRLLQKSCDYINQQPSFGFRADVAFDDVLVPDYKVQYHAIVQAIVVRRPGKFRLDYTGDRRNVRFYYNGKTFSLLDKRANTYASVSAPPTIDATLDQVREQLDIGLPLEDFLYSDPCKGLSSNLQAAYDLGPSRVAGSSTMHLAFRQENIDWQIWIDNEGLPLPRKMVITYKKLPGSPQYTAVFSKWAFKPFDPSMFSYTLPKAPAPIDFLPIVPNKPE